MTATLDGKRHSCIPGSWAVWIPSLQAKFFYSKSGSVICHSKRAPAHDQVINGCEEAAKIGNYVLAEWKSAYGKPVFRRVAEIAVCTQRLHHAGLGPKLLGLCAASSWKRNGELDEFGTLGIMVENAKLLKPKKPASAEDVIAAGVQPDAIMSCVRQQVNGYVVDLSSVVGATPIDACTEIEEVERFLREHCKIVQ